MGRKKLDLNPEERRKYNNEMHRKQTLKRRQKAERETYRAWVLIVLETFKKLGYDSELVLGIDEEALDVVIDEIIKEDKFKVSLGTKAGLKVIK